MCMCMSMRPGRSNAGSSLSLLLVVNTMIRSSPQLDQSPSMKFNSPESVNCEEILVRTGQSLICRRAHQCGPKFRLVEKQKKKENRKGLKNEADKDHP